MKKDLSILVFFLILYAYIGMALGQDVNGDILNYHYYNGYAFAHGYLSYQNLFPGMLQNYFNPLLDAFNYLVILVFKKPIVIAAIESAFSAIATFFLYKISALIFKAYAPEKRLFYICAVLLIGMTGVTCITQVGSMMNDAQAAAFVMAAFYFAAKSLLAIEDKRFKSNAIIAGILMGLATGLKLTSAVYWPALALAGLFYFQSNRRRILFAGMIILAGLLGFLLVNGWWMWGLQQHYGSPFFPLYNKLFHSPFMPDFSYKDKRFDVGGLIGALVLPFRLMHLNNLVVETNYPPIKDWRLAIVFSLTAVAFLRYFVLKVQHKTFANSVLIFWMALFLLAYFLWAFQFGIFRYAIPLLLLSGLCTVLLYDEVVPDFAFKNEALGLILLVILLSTHYTNFLRQDFGKQFIELSGVKPIPNNSMVLMSSSSQSFVAAYFPRQIEWVSLVFVYDNSYSAEAILGSNTFAKNSIAQHQGPIYILAENDSEVPAEQAAQYYHYHIAKDCQTLSSNFGWKSSLYLCPMTKLKLK
ncbi:MAG: hypothetical protein K0S29_543 [Gammaproteobacteria bacterium]|jgi:hypothetical protein|nr:hypothetical protein [Gammaproteobacteria bacterium]